MKQKEILLNSLLKDEKISLSHLNEEEIGEQHISTCAETPLRADAFKLSDDEKMAKIEMHFKAIMETLGLDLNDDSLKGTPKRVAKMYVKEIFNGLDPANKPKVALFENKYKYHQMLVEKDITFYSNCEHHFVPIFGKAHVAYISNGQVIGLSKLNRIVQYFSKRPQVQERMIMQIFNDLKSVLETDNVMIVVEATHLCVSSRGIKDESSYTSTLQYGGVFNQKEFRDDFYKMIHKNL